MRTCNLELATIGAFEDGSIMIFARNEDLNELNDFL